MHALRACALAAVSLIVLSSACGGIVVFGAGDGGSNASSSSGDGGSGAAGSTNDVATSSAGGAGAAGPIIATILSAELFADCQPVVGPDPITGQIVVAYDNTGSTAGSLELAQADIIFASAAEAWVFPISLAPTSSGVVAGFGDATVFHEKGSTDGDSSFVCQLCGMEGTASLRFIAEDGLETTTMQEFTLGCGL